MSFPRCIAITGATGFLGSNLVRHWLARGVRIVGLRRSTSRLHRVIDCADAIRWYDVDRGGGSVACAENPIEAIVHCATNYGRGNVPATELIEANLILPLTLLQLAEHHGIRIFVNTDTILDKDVSTYSLSKKQFVDWLKLYANKLNTINVALEHFYGPFDDESKFVTLIVRSLLRGVDRLALTEGRQKRDFIYIDDVVMAFDRILEAHTSPAGGYAAYEVGTGQLSSIREFVERVRRIVGNERTHLDFGAVPLRANEVFESRVDLTALRGLGWNAETSLEAGLVRTVEWERAHGTA